MAEYQISNPEAFHIKRLEGPPWRNWRADLQLNQKKVQPDSDSTLKANPPTPDLPFDVLGEIFGYGASDLEDPYALLHAASVCSSWRSTSFALAQLWGHIHLYPRYGLVHFQEQLLDLFLERSHDCGLVITMDFNPYQRLSSIILTRLRSQAVRWVQLSIICLHPHDLHELLSPLPSGVSLERLTTLTGVSLNMLNFQFGDAQQSEDSFPMDILLTAPHLHTLHAEIFEPSFFDTRKTWELPDRNRLSSIQDLVVVPGKQAHGLAAEVPPGVGLLPFPNVQRVVIFPRLGYQTLIAKQRSNLISLTLCVSGYSSHNAITDAVRDLTLPLLQHLFVVYVGMHGYYVVKLGPLVSFIQRSWKSLQTFVLDRVPMATKDVLDLLDPLIHLHNLTIHELDPLSPVGRRHFPISQELFNRLLQNHFLPNLRGIDLDWCSSVNGSMYESLLTQVVRLRGLQKIREYWRMGRIGGSRYAFGNDLIPYFETLVMDFEPEELDPGEPSTIEYASGVLTKVGIALPQIDPDDSDQEVLPMVEFVAGLLEAGITLPELIN